MDYTSKVLLMGSCFTENIGGKLDYFKFQNLQNPFGIVFHPMAIEVLVSRALEDRAYTEKDVFFYNEQWHCFEVHSVLSTSTKEDFLQKLNNSLAQLRAALLGASHLIFTYGTAWVYRHQKTNAPVANCHKLPQQEFKKELLSVATLAESIQNTVQRIQAVKPSAVIIGTVSPVRHLRDGFVENTQSKAHLIAGLHKAMAASKGLYYFPSYELMMDELRDYRFYAEDMLHPNTTAISIIWERFKEVWVASATDALQKEIDTVQRGLQHRPFHPESETHRAFQKTLQQKISALQRELPHIAF